MLLTAAEVAERWKCSVRTVHRLVDEGRLVAVVLGRSARSRRFVPAEVERFEASGQPLMATPSRPALSPTWRSPSGETVKQALDRLLAPKRAPKLKGKT